MVEPQKVSLWSLRLKSFKKTQRSWITIFAIFVRFLNQFEKGHLVHVQGRKKVIKCRSKKSY